MNLTLGPALQEYPFFCGLSEAHLKLITAKAKNVTFAEHHYIFREGDPANEFYVIHDGLVSVELVVPSRGATTVQTVDKGEVLGWSWVSPPYRWHFTARTLRPTHALVLDANWMRAKCDEDHDLGYEMLKRFVDLIATRLDATRLQLQDIYSIRS